MSIRTAAIGALALAGGCFSASAAAQEIILYDGPNFTGQQVRVTGQVNNLSAMRFNDRASSLRVVSGQWEVCQHDDFNGTCEVHSGDARSLGRMNNQITSLRPAGYGPGGPGITLYSGPNYTGRSVTLTETTPNLQSVGFNDMARSVRHNGRRNWRACQHADFGGACMEISGDIPSIGGGMAGEISSVEPDFGARPGRPGGGPDRPRSGVFLYDGPGFSGQRVDVTHDVANLEALGFNDRADSLIVARGEIWVICEDDHLGGRCQRVEGEIRDLGQLGLRNEVTSLRRIDDHWGGPGGPGYPGGYRPDVTGGVRGVDAVFFPRPEIRGYAVDRCLGGYGRRCDQETADAICRSAGLRRAEFYEVDRYSRARTWYLGENEACRGGQCEPIVNVLCTD
ncbi:beta/gamma crystallin-related protein [Maricaulis sp.]|uniref:beta/gamma crystallin-related protein n=1 Tax=Maricaulis sp. TaxID=1486257 RepID=UPI002601853D|nr:beta/gamma crystallin-related protein [Maricaulis sp.]